MKTKENLQCMPVPSACIWKYTIHSGPEKRKISILIRFLVAAVLIFAITTSNHLSAQPLKMESLFDGKTLKGWVVRSGYGSFRVEDGTIVGTTAEGSINTFLCTEKEYSDFILEWEVKCDPQLNSGVQFRSHTFGKDTSFFLYGGMQKFNADRVYGYQFEIESPGGFAGCVYDEARLGKWLHDTTRTKVFKASEWNRCRLIAEGDHIRTFVNDVPIADFRDARDKSGFIGLQVHRVKEGTGPFSVRFRNIKIREL